jgi:hypothetical protein
MGPGIPGGSQQATSEELATMSAQVGRLRGPYETVLTQLLAEHGEQLRRTAREVLANGRACIPFAAVTLDAELLNFWHGDRVLRIERTTRDGAWAARWRASQDAIDPTVKRSSRTTWPQAWPTNARMKRVARRLVRRDRQMRDPRLRRWMLPPIGWRQISERDHAAAGRFGFFGGSGRLPPFK